MFLDIAPIPGSNSIRSEKLTSGEMAARDHSGSEGSVSMSLMLDEALLIMTPH